MTIAEKWKSEGRTEGELNDRRELLSRLLSKRFGLLGKERDLVNGCNDLNRLTEAIDAFVDASSKEKVLAKLRT